MRQTSAVLPWLANDNLSLGWSLQIAYSSVGLRADDANISDFGKLRRLPPLKIDCPLGFGPPF